ncbi:MAG: putative glycosyltransferase [Marmoricola sp.]|nr:putative glycosyltransferase [Marmoricola sp.]
MIDLLLPFYGDPDLMRQTVASVLAQDCDDWRLVVVDDGYPDDSIGPWFASLGDPRIRYHRNEVNLGANLNYRRAVELAETEFVVILGADDLALPTFVGDLHQAIAAYPDAHIVSVGVEVIDGTGRPAMPLVDRVKSWMTPQRDGIVRVAGEDLMVSLLHGNWTYFPSLCWRLSELRRIGFRSDLHVAQDLGMLVDVLRDGGTMTLHPQVSFQYRRHAGSDSAVKTLDGARFAEERRYFRTVAAQLADGGFDRAARTARRHVTSRLHAAALLPTAVRTRNTRAAKALVHHIAESARPTRRVLE